VTPERFSRRATLELDNTADWIAKDNPAAADALISGALAAAALLAKNPSLGRQRLDLAPPSYRFWPLRGFPYVLVYDADTVPPTILRIIHQARDLPTALV
jgi:toxin ParE1/3/4